MSNATSESAHLANGPTAAESPVRGTKHVRLDVFVGSWKGDGPSLGQTMLAAESYEWLEGGFFLISRFSQRVGSAHHLGLGVIGYDAASGAYTSRLVDNQGYDRTYNLREEPSDTWTLSGGRERATYVFSDAGSKLHIRWEQSKDGLAWTPLCDLRCAKQQSANVH